MNAKRDERRPAVSVVIPTFNRVERLKRVLTGLSEQVGVDPFETVVVSDGSDDGTDEYLGSDDVPLPVVALRQDNEGPARARNAGIRAASGDIVLFLDDDVVPTPDLVHEHLAAHARLGHDTVAIGPMSNPPDHEMSMWVRYEQAMLAKQYGAMARGEWSATARQFYTGNASVRRTHLIEVGGFDTSLRRAEDVELAWRLAARGIQFAYVPSAIGLHYADRSFEAWRDIALAYGEHDVRLASNPAQGHMLGVMIHEYGRRNLLIRTLVYVAGGRPRVSGAAERFFLAIARLADGHVGDIVTSRALSGVYNLAYYSGVIQAFGGRREFWRLRRRSIATAMSPRAIRRWWTERSAAQPESDASNESTGVLFMQSQEFFGADSQIHASIMRHLDRSEFDVHCAVPKDGSVPSVQALRSVPEVTLRPTDFGPSLEGAGPSALLRVLPGAISLVGLAWYVRRRGIRIVHCTEKPRDAVYGTVIAALGGAECVIHVHVKAEDWIRSVVRRAMGAADGLIGVSEFVAQSLRDMGYDPSRVHAVLNGLEIAEWSVDDVDTGAVRAALGIEAEVPMILSASRLYRWKGQHDLIAAFAIVQRRLPDAVLVIVGADDPRGTPGEEPYSAVLERLAHDLGVADNVVFTGWRSDVRALMAACDVFAMPSFEEPFGMVFVEAMYLRRPVVALDNGGTREVVDSGGSGLLSAPGDVDSLAHDLEQLLTEPELCRRLGEHGRARVVDVLNSERMAQEVGSVYHQLLGHDR